MARGLGTSALDVQRENLLFSYSGDRAHSTLTLDDSTAPCPVQSSLFHTHRFRYSKPNINTIQCMGSSHHSYFRRHCKLGSTISVFYLLHVAKEAQGYLHLKTENSFTYHHFPGAGEVCLVMPKLSVNSQLPGSPGTSQEM